MVGKKVGKTGRKIPVEDDVTLWCRRDTNGFTKFRGEPMGRI